MDRTGLGSKGLGSKGFLRQGLLRQGLFYGGLVLVAGLVWLGCKPAVRDTPVFTVESRPFQHRVTAEGRLEATHSTKLQVPSETRGTVRLSWLAPEGSRLKQGDVVARFDGKPLREKLQDSRTDFESNQLELERSEIRSDVELGGLEKDLSVAELELEHAKRFQKTNVDVFSRRDILEDAIDGELAEDRKSHAQTSAGTRRSLAQTEQDLLNIQRRRVEMEIERAQDGLQALEIVAPHDGVLALATDWRGEKPAVGAEMWQGQEIGRIPDMSVMQAQVFVLEADAGGLAEGRTAEVIIEAHPEKVYKATIKNVAAVAKPRFPGSPVQYFAVTLEFEATDREIMKPGGRVTASLFLEDREQALVVPRQALFHGLEAEEPAEPLPPTDGPEGTSTPARTMEDRAQVYVKNGSGFAVRTVIVGPTSLGQVVIEDGLEAGDVIALAEPWNDAAGQGGGGGGSAMALGGS